MPEQTMARLNPTRILFLRYYLLTIIFIVLGIVLFLELLPTVEFIPKYYYLSLPIIGLIPAILAEIRIREDTYIITDQKITERVGFLSIEENSVTWDRLSNYTLKQSFLDRILGVGTIELWSIGEEERPEISIKKVSYIKKIIELLDKLIKTRKGPVV